MRISATLVSTVALTLGFAAATFAAPQGMAPYPGQSGAYAAPPPPPVPGEVGSAGQAIQPAATTPRKGPGCVWTRRIDGWQPGGRDTMILTNGRKRFLVTFSTACNSQRYENAIRITRSWGSCLSPGDSIEFADRYDNGTGYGYRRQIYESCIISKIELAPERTAQR